MPKVMVIEDDPMMASLVQAFLQLEGIDVVLLDHDPSLGDIFCKIVFG